MEQKHAGEAGSVPTSTTPGHGMDGGCGSPEKVGMADDTALTQAETAGRENTTTVLQGTEHKAPHSGGSD